jgi:hypothetical protein
VAQWLGVVRSHPEMHFEVAVCTIGHLSRHPHWLGEAADWQLPLCFCFCFFIFILFLFFIFILFWGGHVHPRPPLGWCVATPIGWGRLPIGSYPFV